MKNKKLIDDAKDIEKKRMKEDKGRISSFKWKKILSIIAGISLIVCISLYVNYKGANSFIKPVMNVIYPKSFAFDDYDSWNKVVKGNPVEDSTIEAINNFNYETGSLILKTAEKNTNYSPLSLYYALSLATTGAETETEEELLGLLGIKDSVTLSEQSGNLYRLLYRDNKIGKLKIANSLWLDNEVNGQPVIFKDSFVGNAVKNFYAHSFSVDFSDEKTGKAMGKWISENTNGTLTPEIETNSDQVLSIINTVYFYDQWVNRFDKNSTKKDDFYLLNDEIVQVEFMNQTINASGYSKGSNFSRASLGLKNGGEVKFILPDEGVSPYDLLSSPDKIKEIFKEGETFYGEVFWKVPKFKFNTELNLKDSLKKLKINLAFEPNADFSRITDMEIFITDVQQQTYISVDEDGVEASAFTQIDFSGTGLPENYGEMILNRPFIYGITAPNGILLFVGICLNPSA